MFCVCYLKNHGSVMFPFALLLLNFMFIASEKTYINQYAVHIKDGRTGLERVLQSTGLVNRGQIGDLEDHYFLEIPQRERRSASHSQEHHDLLSSHSDVHWFEQQIHRPRYKRDHIPNPTADNLNDNLYGAQWYLHGGGKGGYDMNVIPAWKKGYSGRDVVISILDDGIERTHPDLKENYDPYASYDVNSHDNDPMPRYDPTDENRHGTRCAGEVSAVANNTVCGVGIAPHSRIGGVRMLDGEVYDAVEAASLSFNRSHIDIYSASWGPDDDGRVVDGPGPLAKKAFIDGITLGRNKKGSIYVWASGNGGNAQDSCNCDGYTNSVYTLSISSTSERGQKPWYLEECSSTLATTYSSGSYNEKQIITVDLRGRCTQTHTGTSASAPLAAGVVALVLEANPSLTWRDVQYITLLSANPVPMVDGQWMTNALGRKVSLRYGYGLMDASAMVDLAEVWTNIPEQHICEVNSNVNNVHLDGTTYIDSIVTQACDGMANGVKFLEHVQVIIGLTHKRRGDVIIYITSPSGTKSKLLPKRPNDRQEGEFKNWPFLSVHFWGEDPNGRWTLEIEDAKSYNPHGTTGGVLRSWSIVFHGTATQPINLKNGTSITPPATVKATTATTSQPLTGSTTSPKPFTCHFECKKNCTGPKPENCNACKNVRLGSTGACIDVCPEGFYNNEGYCQACDSTCKTCSGPTLSECLTCNTNRFYTEKHHICVDKCLTGYFKDTIEPVTNESLQSRNDIVCSKKSIQLLIPKTYLHSTEWKLNDPGCRTRFNGTHILKEFGLNECGTTVEFSNHSLIFRNELRDAYGSSADGTISIECNYPETQNLSNYDFPVRDRVVLYEKNKGLLGVIRMNQYRKDDFTEVVSEYPAEIQPDGSINIQLVIEENQSKIGVRAENCIATTTRSPANNENTKLYENGCESRVVRVRKTRSNEIKFSFKLSAIPQNQSTIVSTVYVHCEVAACSFHECDATCNNRRRKRSSHQSYVITTGPIMFTTLKRESEGSSLIAIACLSLSALAVIIALMALISRKVQA